MKMTAQEKLDYNQSYFEANKEKIYAQRKARRNTTVRGRLYALCNNARIRANRESWDFDLTVDFLEDMWLEQKGICAISGVQMVLTSPTGKRFSNDVVSIDRIDSYGGYTQDNIWLVSSKVNYAKGVQSYEEFLEMCRQIVRNADA